MTLRVEVRFDPRTLVRANDGLDLDSCAQRYADALQAAIERDLPAALVSVRSEGHVGALEAVVTGGSDAECASFERTVRDLGWVVREMVPFA